MGDVWAVAMKCRDLGDPPDRDILLRECLAAEVQPADVAAMLVDLHHGESALAEVFPPVDDFQGEPPPEHVEKFRNLRKVGTGGFGSVWRADDPDTHGSVAIKLYPRAQPGDPVAVELDALAKLSQIPGVVRVFTTGTLPESDGRRYLIMEFVEGQTLHACLANCPEGRLPLATARRMLNNMLSSLAKIHRVGEASFVHCDLKPGNIMIRDDETPVFIDFGIARRIKISPEPPWNRRSHILTREYVAPEVANGAAPTPQSDLFQLGLVAFEMIVGKRFRSLPENEAWKRLQTCAGASVAGKRLARAIRRALAPNPFDRFKNAGDFRAAINRKSLFDAGIHMLGLRVQISVALVALLVIGSLATWQVIAYRNRQQNALFFQQQTARSQHQVVVSQQQIASALCLLLGKTPSYPVGTVERDITVDRGDSWRPFWVYMGTTTARVRVAGNKLSYVVSMAHLTPANFQWSASGHKLTVTAPRPILDQDHIGVQQDPWNVWVESSSGWGRFDKGTYVQAAKDGVRDELIKQYGPAAPPENILVDAQTRLVADVKDYLASQGVRDADVEIELR